LLEVVEHQALLEAGLVVTEIQFLEKHLVQTLLLNLLLASPKDHLIL
jgi:hypothetical protein